MDESLLQKIRDPRFYLEHFTKIKTKEHGLQPFILNRAQLDLFNTLKKSSRVIIRKARQLGCSTAIAGFLYHLTITTPGINTALIGYNSELTTELLDKVKTFIRSTPESLRPKISYNSKTEIAFPAIDSKMLILPSTENVGRGYTLFAAHITELPYWEKAEEKMQSLENSIPIGGKLIIESSPGQIGDQYHRMWMAEDNGYVKKDYGWWWGYTQAEADIIQKRLNDPQKWAQEYCLEFSASGRPVFPYALVKKLKEFALKVGDKVTYEDGGELVNHTVSEDIDKFRIYRPPQKGKKYVMGADVAEGVIGGDNSTCIILERESGEEVAMWKGLMAADKFGFKLCEWGKMYNNALAVVEINNHGLTTVTAMRNLLYPQMYFRPSKFDQMGTSYTDRCGWKTTRTTKPLMVDDLHEHLREGSIKLHSTEIFDEMLTYIYTGSNESNAIRGFHDDLIMGCAIAIEGFKIMYAGKLDQLPESMLPVSGF